MTLRGELDITCVELLEKALAAAEATVPSVIIVDLAHLEFMDSSGLAATIKAKQKADGCGLRLGIVNATGAVHRAFELTASNPSSNKPASSPESPTPQSPSSCSWLWARCACAPTGGEVSGSRSS